MLQATVRTENNDKYFSFWNFQIIGKMQKNFYSALFLIYHFSTRIKILLLAGAPHKTLFQRKIAYRLIPTYQCIKANFDF